MTIRHGTVLAVAAGLMLGGTAYACPGGGDRAAFREAAAAAFTEADADGSGGLNAEEFANFHEILRAKIDAARFDQLDTDGDGAVTQAELEAGRPMRGGRKRGPQS